MRILALVPARGGSKRIPRKLLRVLGGKPLISWTMDAARDIPQICDLLVSTDDTAIAAIGREANALVPWLRPPELATDTATSVDVALHALNWYETEKGLVDGFLLLQPSSPFRTRETITSGIALFERNGRNPVLGVSPVHAHPMWTFTIEGERLVPFTAQHGFETRSQDLPEAFVVNGSLYLLAPADLRFTRSFVGVAATPLRIDSPRESLDIDTEWDWQVAEWIAQSMQSAS